MALRTSRIAVRSGVVSREQCISFSIHQLISRFFPAPSIESRRNENTCASDGTQNQGPDVESRSSGPPDGHVQDAKVARVAPVAPPDPPAANLCCMSGCANCVWLDYADDMLKHFERQGQSLKTEEILELVDKSVDDQMVKAFIKMEIKSKFLFKATTTKPKS